MPTDNSKIIERLNSVIVTPEELSEVLDEADKLHDSGLVPRAPEQLVGLVYK